MHAVPRVAARHPRTTIGAALVVVAAAIVSLAAWPGHSSSTSLPAVYAPPTRARTYTTYTACLLTGSGGITDPHAAPVWAGMQAASTATHARATYLSIQGAQTAANAGVYINTLALQGCSLILTAGTLAGQGAIDRAAAIPRTHLITVGAPATKSDNVTAVTATDPAAITSDVTKLVTAAAEQGTPTP